MPKTTELTKLFKYKCLEPNCRVNSIRSDKWGQHCKKNHHHMTKDAVKFLKIEVKVGDGPWISCRETVSEVRNF